MDWVIRKHIVEAIKKTCQKFSKGVPDPIYISLDELVEVVRKLPETAKIFPVRYFIPQHLEDAGYDTEALTTGDMYRISQIVGSKLEFSYDTALQEVAHDWRLPKKPKKEEAIEKFMKGMMERLKSDYAALDNISANGIQNMYNSFCEVHGHAPKFAKVKMQYNNNEKPFETYVALQDTVYDDETDDKIFYYCKDLEAFKELLKLPADASDSTAFWLVNVLEFTDEII